MTEKKAASKKAAPKAAAPKKTVAKAAAPKKVAAAAPKKAVAKVAAPKKAAAAAPKKAVAKVAAPKKAAAAAPKKAVAKVAAPKKAAAAAPKKAVAKVAAPKKAAVKAVEVVVKAPAAVKKAAPKKASRIEESAALYPESVVIAARELFTLRAEAVQLLDLRGISDVADWFLVATCTSEAQMQAILNTLTKDYKAAKIPTVGVEYRAGVQWAVLDVGELMVHLFEENKRKEFSLDLLWREGKQVELDADDFVSAKAKVAKSDEFV